MPNLDHITTPEKALDEIKKTIRYGRDLIGKAEWAKLKEQVGLIRSLIGLLHNWSTVLPNKVLNYDKEKTKDILGVLNLIESDIDRKEYTENLYGYRLAVGGDFCKQVLVGVTWQILEVAFDMDEEYRKSHMVEEEGVAEDFGDVEALGEDN
jgi:hypothetical protein